MDIRENLRNYIEDKSIFKTAVARKSGMAYLPFISMLNKNRRLEANELLNICDALGVSIDEIRKYKC